jgi:hypothetical protein
VVSLFSYLVEVFLNFSIQYLILFNHLVYKFIQYLNKFLKNSELLDSILKKFQKINQKLVEISLISFD